MQSFLLNWLILANKFRSLGSQVPCLKNCWLRLQRNKKINNYNIRTCITMKLTTHSIRWHVHASNKSSACYFDIPITQFDKSCYSFPLFNFHLDSEGFLIAQFPGLAKSSRKFYPISANDAFLIPWTIENVPTSFPVACFVLKVQKQSWKLGCFLSADLANGITKFKPIPAGDHTVNAQRVGNIAKSKSCTARQPTPTLLEAQVVDANGYPFLDTNNFGIQTRVKSSRCKTRIHLDAFNFTSTDQIPPNDPFGAPTIIPDRTSHRDSAFCLPSTVPTTSSQLVWASMIILVLAFH